MHGMDAWDWIWVIPMMVVMMFAWIAPVVLGAYVAIRLANRPR